MIGKDPTAATTPPTDPGRAAPDANAGSAAESKNMLSEHKGKLAIGVAATLGIMIFYSWRQKQLSKEDPEAYARLQRIKDSVRSENTPHKHKADETRREPTPDK